MEREGFQEISDRWATAFDAPYIGRAELWDYGMKIGLAVFRDGEKVWESRNNIAGPLRNVKTLDAIIEAAKRSGSRTTHTELGHDRLEGRRSRLEGNRSRLEGNRASAEGNHSPLEGDE